MSSTKTILSLHFSAGSDCENIVETLENKLQEIDKPTNRPYTSRYIGSLVADFHRNLLKGGVYIYPRTASSPNGKIRLLYECNPIAFLAEQAGGKATDGYGHRILDIVPKEIHQRTPFVVGSKEMVEKVEEFMAEYGD